MAMTDRVARRETRGGRLMSSWIAGDRSRSWAGLASKLGVTTMSLWQWRYGEAVPDPRNRELLQAATDIPAIVWSSKAEQEAEVEHAERLTRLREERQKHVATLTSGAASRKVRTRSAADRSARG